jgi:hypothetical protein
MFTTVCSTDSNLSSDDDWTEIIADVGESLVRRRLTEKFVGFNDKRTRRVATKDLAPVKIISIIFAEVSSDGSLVVINKEETLANVDLGDKSVVEFDSISKTLDPEKDINEQSLLVPGGVTILLVGENSNGELVKTRMLWLYNNVCDAVPLTETGELGWITVVSMPIMLFSHLTLIDSILTRKTRCPYQRILENLHQVCFAQQWVNQQH